MRGHTVTVINDSPDYGSVSPEGAVAYREGATVTIACTPEDGYELSAFYLDPDVGGSSTGSSISFTMGEEDVKVLVFFAEIPTYPLDTYADPDGGGTISPSSGEYKAGESITITAAANEGFVFDHLEINGVSYDSPSQTVTMTEEGIEAVAYFTRNFTGDYLVIVTGGANATVSPSSGPTGTVSTVSYYVPNNTSAAVDVDGTSVYGISEGETDESGGHSETLTLTIQESDVYVSIVYLK